MNGIPLIPIIIPLVIVSITYLYIKLKNEYDDIQQGDFVSVYDRKTGHLLDCEFPVVVVNGKKYYIKDGKYVEITFYDLFSGNVVVYML